MNIIQEAFSHFHWQDFIDITVVTVIIYNALVFSKGNRSKQLIQGIIIIFLLYISSNMLKLYTLNWMLEKLSTIFLIALIIVFQPELRAALEKLGRTSSVGLLFSADVGLRTAFFKNIIQVVVKLAEYKIGSLIVLQQTTGLKDILESGTEIDGVISPELLMCIFQGKNPLHDGAVIITNNKIAAAGCLLPLTDNKLVEKRLGTRHRAAIGLSEQSDSIIIVTSEETGIISIAQNGNLTRYLTKETLEEYLFENALKEGDSKLRDVKKIRDILKKEVVIFGKKKHDSDEDE